MIEPQAGKQTEFLASSADIVLYGGSAGAGKSFALLMEAVRHISVSGFGAVIFRKNLTQITKEGALWDTASKFYPLIGGRGVKGNDLTYYWDSFGSKISFSYLRVDAHVRKWQGTQIPLICFDELTHFSKYQFFYMLSRNRTTCGVTPYIRATTNPDPDSWVREFIDWWIGDDGFVIEERSGVVRWFVNVNDVIHWFSSKEECNELFPDTPAKSFTFIAANVHDNQKLLESDPNYIANLKALPKVEMERLLLGNWNSRVSMGDYFKGSNFRYVGSVLPKMVKTVRAWDFASSIPSAVNNDPDYTVGLKAGLGEDGNIYVLDVIRVRMLSSDVTKLVIDTAKMDGKDTVIRIPIDPGSAGKVVSDMYVKSLLGYVVNAVRVTGSKISRCLPASSQVGNGNVYLVRGDWNLVFVRELENFPMDKHDDQVDVFSDAVEELGNKQNRMQVMNKLPVRIW